MDFKNAQVDPDQFENNLIKKKKKQTKIVLEPKMTKN